MKTDKRNNLIDQLEGLGFALIGTGGNCTAYQRESDGYEWLATDREMNAIEEGGKVGLYCLKDGELVGSWLAESLADLIASLDNIFQDAPRWQGRTDVETGIGEAFTEQI